MTLGLARYILFSPYIRLHHIICGQKFIKGGLVFMLTKQDRESIRSIQIFESSIMEDNKGFPLTHEQKTMNIPTTSELRDEVSRRLQLDGFSVSFASPVSANAIIRVYEKLHYPYERDIKINLYGAHIYTREGFAWITGEKYEYNPEKHTVRLWFFQDEYVDIPTVFFDTYVYIRKLAE